MLLLQLSSTVTDKVIAARGDLPIGIDSEFHYGHALMIIYARQEPLTYGKLNAVLRAMARFATTEDSFGYQVEIKDASRLGTPTVGRARLSYV